MWTAKFDPTSDLQRQPMTILRNGKPLTFGEVLQFWSENETFNAYFNSLLTNAPYKAFRWETPPLTKATTSRNFEFVLLESNALDRPVDQKAFSKYFKRFQEIITFDNLGRDAILIVPCPIGNPNSYGHLAAFLREAPERQTIQIWKHVANAMISRLNANDGNPVWLSTAGMGVSWLHIRLDDRPKYYGYAAYRNE